MKKEWKDHIYSPINKIRFILKPILKDAGLVYMLGRSGKV